MKHYFILLIHFYFIVFSLSSNTTSEHSNSSAAANRQAFLNSNFTADPKAFAPAAPRREPETILLEESDETDHAAETREEGIPKPVKVGDKVYIPQLPSLTGINSYWDNADDKRMLKRYRANTNDGHENDFDFNDDNTTSAKLPAANK